MRMMGSMNTTLPPPDTSTFAPPQTPSDGSTGRRRFARPRDDRRIAGVCAAVARRFDLDVTTVRLVTALSILLPGPQVLAYLIGWLILPNDD